MRYLQLKHSIPARRWVKRWMLVTAYLINFLPGRIINGIKWAWEDAHDHADQWKLRPHDKDTGE